MRKKETGLILAIILLGLMLVGIQSECLAVADLPQCYNGVDDDADGVLDDLDLNCNYVDGQGQGNYCPWWNDESFPVAEATCDNAEQQFIATHGTYDLSALACSDVSGLNAFFEFYDGGEGGGGGPIP
jgi:hypothetical protein